MSTSSSASPCLFSAVSVYTPLLSRSEVSISARPECTMNIYYECIQCSNVHYALTEFLEYTKLNLKQWGNWTISKCLLTYHGIVFLVELQTQRNIFSVRTSERK